MQSNSLDSLVASTVDESAGGCKSNAVISFIVENGTNRVLSRYGDAVWDLSPYTKTANREPSAMRVCWSSMPQSFVPGVKAVAHRYWVAGRPGGLRPSSTSVYLLVASLRRFLLWVSSLGIERLADITPLHCTAWVQRCRQKKLAPRSQKMSYWAIEALYVFRAHGEDAMQTHPWPESSARRLSGLADTDQTIPSTKLIPPPVVERLFRCSLELIDRADGLIERRDAGRISWRHTDLVLLRTACYVVLGLVSGCRNHELASIETGAIRQSTHDGEVFYWLRGHSLKTHTGYTEWMIPEVGVRCVRILERLAIPMQAEIGAALVAIEQRLVSMPTGSREYTTLLNQRRELEADRHRLLLGKKNGSLPGCVTASCWKQGMKQFAQYVGTDWDLATHQLRRTFAANVANHVLGDLVYLKHHYKHWSLDMTALYALNAQQEEELFDEVLHAVREKKIRIIQHWLDNDTMIIGGAAGPIKAFRAKHQLASVTTRRRLIEDTAEVVNIRATGHGWCLASDMGCGGQGLYEPTRCRECRNGVMDDGHVPVWKNILAHQRELLVTAADCGSSGKRRVERDLAEAETVLREFGIDVNGGSAT